jgi:hypothetical protein
MYVRKRVPWFRPEDHAHLLDGLRNAGSGSQDTRGKLDARFEGAGEQQLKNIAKPVLVYRVRFAGRDTQAAIPKRLALPDKPSIAVLPFQNMRRPSRRP